LYDLSKYHEFLVIGSNLIRKEYACMVHAYLILSDKIVYA